jgi:hypothetical protein
MVSKLRARHGHSWSGWIPTTSGTSLAKPVVIGEETTLGAGHGGRGQGQHDPMSAGKGCWVVKQCVYSEGVLQSSIHHVGRIQAVPEAGRKRPPQAEHPPQRTRARAAEDLPQHRVEGSLALGNIPAAMKDARLIDSTCEPADSLSNDPSTKHRDPRSPTHLHWSRRQHQMHRRRSVESAAGAPRPRVRSRE